MARARIIVGVSLAVLLSTACATIGVYDRMGVKEKRFESISRILDRGDDILIEFDLANPDEPPDHAWSLLPKKDLWKGPYADAVAGRMRRGRIPPDEAAASSELPACLSLTELPARRARLDDACGRSPRSVTLLFDRKGAWKARWRPFALPFVLPVAFVYDLVSSPFYLIYHAVVPTR